MLDRLTRLRCGQVGGDPSGVVRLDGEDWESTDGSYAGLSAFGADVTTETRPRSTVLESQ